MNDKQVPCRFVWGGKRGGGKRGLVSGWEISMTTSTNKLTPTGFLRPAPGRKISPVNRYQEFIDIVETIYRGARKGRGLVMSPKAPWQGETWVTSGGLEPTFSQLKDGPKFGEKQTMAPIKNTERR